MVSRPEKVSTPGQQKNLKRQIGELSVILAMENALARTERETRQTLAGMLRSMKGEAQLFKGSAIALRFKGMENPMSSQNFQVPPEYYIIGDVSKYRSSADQPFTDVVWLKMVEPHDIEAFAVPLDKLEVSSLAEVKAAERAAQNRS